MHSNVDPVVGARPGALLIDLAAAVLFSLNESYFGLVGSITLFIFSGRHRPLREFASHLLSTPDLGAAQSSYSAGQTYAPTCMIQGIDETTDQNHVSNLS